MRKVDDGEEKKKKRKKRKKRKEKIMTFILATNVIASRPPERRPTGTPHARAKILSTCYVLLVYSSLSKGKPIKPRNFEDHPRRRGFSSEAKLFNEVKYVHVLRIGRGEEGPRKK